MISTRPKSPTRAEAIAKALKPGPVFCTGVLQGNWVEDRTECPKSGTFYFPPKEEIDYDEMKPESRQPDFRLNKLNSLQGSVQSIIRHDSHDACKNFASTNDLVYNHLPKPLCGPDLRHYKRSAHQFYPQPDLMKCFGNVTEWGLRKYKKYEWACTDVSEYMSTLYEDTFVPPRRDQYLHSCERKARNSWNYLWATAGCGGGTRAGEFKYCQPTRLRQLQVHSYQCRFIVLEKLLSPGQLVAGVHNAIRRAISKFGSFTKEFRYKMTKPKSTKKQ